MGLIQLKLTYIQRGVQEILKKSREVKKEDTNSVDKSKAEEVRRNSLETFSKQGIELKMKRVYQNQNEKGETVVRLLNF